jgi:hypothetical protein
VSARLRDEDAIARDVEARIRHTARSLDAVKGNDLPVERRELLASARDFLAKARHALAARDLLRARTLAEKASKLAAELGPRPPPPRGPAGGEADR